MSVKETHLSGSPSSVSKYVSEEKDAHKSRSGEEYTTGYYSENDKVQSMWIGKGADAQGLSGSVKSEDLEKLLAGTTMDGEDISGRGGHNAERRMGSDWTFSAPKAASILAIEDPRIKGWMMEAAAEAIEEYYAPEMAYARLGKGGAVTEFSENIAAAAYLHETARAADGTIDPQIHVHCVAPNMIQRADGQWVSLRADYGQNNSKVYTLGDVQVAKLMRKMQEKGGYELETRLERDDKGIEHLSFGAKGISKEAEDAFSGRKKQINAYLEKNGIDPAKATRAQKDAAAINTRAAKDKNVDNVNLKYEQRQRARDAGLDLSGIRANAERRAKHGNEQQHERKITGNDVVKSAIKHLAERDDVFSRSDLLAEAVKAGAGDVSLKDIHKAIDDRAGGLVHAADVDRDGTGKNEQYFTTKTAVLREAEILQRAKDGQGQAEALIAINDQEQIKSVVQDVSFTEKELENGKRNGSKQQTGSEIGGTQETQSPAEHGLRSLSERSLDAHEVGQNPELLSDHEIPDRSGNLDLRRADDGAVSRIIAEREAKQGFSFSDGQREAVGLALTSTDRHIGIVGAAGAGKTTAMAAIVEQYKAAGYEIVGVAPSAAAAHELESAGCNDTRTLASSLLKKEDAAKEGETPPKRLYVLDEAGMVSAKDMDAFLRKADSEGARTILVGDPLQLAAVEAGSPYAQMLKTNAIAHANIDEIQRQKDPQLREIAQAFAKGEAEKGVELAKPYMQQVSFDKADGKDAKQDALATAAATAYLELTPDERRKTLLLAGTNSTRQAINDKIRAGLTKDGTLGTDAIKSTALDKLDLTREAATRAEHYTSKDGAPVIIQFNTDLKNKDTSAPEPFLAKKGTQWNVMSTENGKLQLQSRDDPSQTIEMQPTDARIIAYAARDMELRDGDRVAFRQNQKDQSITNGMQGTVAIDENGKTSVKTDAGQEIEIAKNRGQTLDYSYARTVHSSQGATVERAIVVGEASRVATAESAYVACSREKTGLTIITDDTKKLGKAWSKFADRQSAMDAAKSNTPETLEEIQKARMAAGKEIGSVGDLAQVRAQGNATQSELPSQIQAAEQQAESLSSNAESGDSSGSGRDGKETAEQKLQHETEQQQEQHQEMEMEMGNGG